MHIATLTNQEITNLKALHRAADHRREADRIKAIILAHGLGILGGTSPGFSSLTKIR